MKFSDVNLAEAAATTARACVDMSEFWGEGAVIYARPITTRDNIKVNKKFKGWPESDRFEGSLWLLTYVCQDEAGEQYFDQPIKNVKQLAALPLAQIERMLSILADDDDDDDEARVGNS